MKATRAPAMAALLPPSSVTTSTATSTAAANCQFPLNFRLESNSIKFRASHRIQKNTLYKLISTSFQNPQNNPLNIRFPAAQFSVVSQSAARVNATASSSMTDTVASDRCSHWMVLTERPSGEINQSRKEIVNYYVDILQRVLGSEKDPQSCIYDVSCDTNFGFCCDINEETSKALAGLPGVLLVRPDPVEILVKRTTVLLKLFWKVLGSQPMEQHCCFMLGVLSNGL